jgi:hypothetical protein
MASDLVTAPSPPLVSDASADGTPLLAWSTRLVEMLTTCPPPCVSIAAMACYSSCWSPPARCRTATLPAYS